MIVYTEVEIETALLVFCCKFTFFARPGLRFAPKPIIDRLFKVNLPRQVSRQPRCDFAVPLNRQ